MTTLSAHEQHPIRQSGAAAVWRVDPDCCTEDLRVPAERCRLHEWTCIWCSMTLPICGSCRPVTPPCPANDQVHVCACSARHHGQRAA